ncbi:MAG: HAMP domain-containing protein [Candidatus Nealsonbacteria bacterium]|nr:HAMP domain-containing protein [Candidatus Nealsonbacteria bacterium]
MKSILKKKISGSIETKLNILIGFFLIVIFIGTASILIDNNKKSLTERLISQAKSFSQLSVGPIIESYELYFDSGYLKFRELTLKTLELNSDISRIQIVDTEGNILADTESLKKADVWQKYEPEEEQIPETLKKNLQSSQEYFVPHPQKKELISEILYPYSDDWGKYSYNVRYFISYERVENDIRKIRIQIIIFSIGALILTIYLMGRGVNKVVVSPIKEFQKGVKKISEGELGEKIKIKTGDEIESLAEEFNLMIERLKESGQQVEEARNVLEVKVKARTRELAELNQTLDERVKERTKELLERLEELEEYQQINMGRDLRVAELNREIKKLKEEIEELKRQT